ncbi:helix-turn-helix transcriptional regulator [Bacillus cereus group sp. BfR-BA-01349]|uniref:helix-turn-helix domain-containing protein n=1 Tax=Bacillus cereus group sp. BfR-BA-01349 TaxID=2920312 RepID=UPI001F5AB7A9
MIKIELGEYIRKVRKEKKLSLRKAAELTGVSHPYLSQLETGSNKKPSIEILEKLALGLDLHNNYLTYLAGYYKMPHIEYDENLTDEEKEEKIWAEIHKVDGGFTNNPFDILSPYPQDPPAAQYNDDKNKLFKTATLACEHNQPFPIIVDKENKVNIEVYKENGLTLNEQDTRELTAMINGFLYGKKFVSKEDEENTAFEDAYNDEDKNY